MKKVKLTQYTHSSSNDEIINFLEWNEMLGINVRFKLADRLQERGLTVRKCAEITGLRLATISDIMNGKKSSVTFQHLWVIMLALGITDINNIIELYIPQDIKDAMDSTSTEWIKTQEIPEPIIKAKSILQGEIPKKTPEEMQEILRLYNYLK